MAVVRDNDNQGVKWGLISSVRATKVKEEGEEIGRGGGIRIQGRRKDDECIHLPRTRTIVCLAGSRIGGSCLVRLDLS